MIEHLTDDPKLAACLKVLEQAEGLKLVERRSYVPGSEGPRPENAAEHSWHAALAALLLADTADEPIDVGRVIQMLLIHDLVEIETGDVFVFDEAGQAERFENESAAAERIFRQLPEPMAHRLLDLWHEFEAKQTPESRFAKAVDRLLPQLMHLQTEGKTWRDHGVSIRQVKQIQKTISQRSAELGKISQQVVNQATSRGHLSTNADLAEPLQPTQTA
ncbi:MAG: HD domain-containing protein [Planctomycetota bacterium]